VGASKQQKPPDAPKKTPEPDVQLFAWALAQRLPVEVMLHDATVVIGQIKAYGQYTIEVELAGGERVVLYKNFVRCVRRAGDPR
jgi:hypothetical protein